jgi:hypothetical protein
MGGRNWDVALPSPLPDAAVYIAITTVISAIANLAPNPIYSGRQTRTSVRRAVMPRVELRLGHG